MSDRRITAMLAGIDATAWVAGLSIAFDATLDLHVAMLDVELREAATRVRAIRTLDDFDARTAEIVAQSTASR